MSAGDDGHVELYQELDGMRYQWSAALALLATAAISGAEVLQEADPRDAGRFFAVARRIRAAVEQVAGAHSGYHAVYRRWEETAGR